MYVGQLMDIGLNYLFGQERYRCVCEESNIDIYFWFTIRLGYSLPREHAS